MLLEVIVQTIDDARAAAQGGADRLEIVREITLGGLTPPIELVRAIAAETRLPLRVMIRDNAGFETNAGELRRMRGAIEALREIAAQGVDVAIVTGFARNGAAALDDVAALFDGMDGMRATFHRAFDSLADPLGSIDAIASVPQIDRILTSGGAGSPSVRAERLGEFVARAGDRLTIVAGGGVDEACVALFATLRTVSEVHVGRAARDGRDQKAAVSADSVRRLRHLTNSGTPNRDTQRWA
ncbi:MAG TPA: copper homeostasis protein CutC [Vicinamibacterales bacterium]|jgi:copper homeostasis protein